MAGTQRAAQQYVDKITRSLWWSRHCKPSWMRSEYDDQGNEYLCPPSRIWVKEDATHTGAEAHLGFLVLHNGERAPEIVLGRGKVFSDLLAIEDPWVILHEVAHVMAVGERDVWRDTWHDSHFIYCYHRLVQRYLGKVHADYLKDACYNHKIRLDYSLI